MTLSSRLARPMLASVFVAGGLDAIRSPQGKMKMADAVVKPLSKWLPTLSRDPETAVRINGAVQVGGGLLLSLGKLRRLAALALIGSVIPTTYAGHRFWEEMDETTRAEQRSHFLKNLGLLGGLVLAAMDREGAPSLGWRAKRRANEVGGAVAAQSRASGRRLAGLWPALSDHLDVVEG